jgi:hypothetical protein
LSAASAPARSRLRSSVPIGKPWDQRRWLVGALGIDGEGIKVGKLQALASQEGQLDKDMREEMEKSEGWLNAVAQ